MVWTLLTGMEDLSFQSLHPRRVWFCAANPLYQKTHDGAVVHWVQCWKYLRHCPQLAFTNEICASSLCYADMQVAMTQITPGCHSKHTRAAMISVRLATSGKQP